MRYRGSLVVCQFAHSKKMRAAKLANEKGYALQMKNERNTSDLLHCTFDIDLTLILNAIYTETWRRQLACH